jgi:hypothetical protein
MKTKHADAIAALGNIIRQQQNIAAEWVSSGGILNRTFKDFAALLDSPREMEAMIVALQSARDSGRWQGPREWVQANIAMFVWVLAEQDFEKSHDAAFEVRYNALAERHGIIEDPAEEDKPPEWHALDVEWDMAKHRAIAAAFRAWHEPELADAFERDDTALMAEMMRNIDAMLGRTVH